MIGCGHFQSYRRGRTMMPRRRRKRYRGTQGEQEGVHKQQLHGGKVLRWTIIDLQNDKTTSKKQRKDLLSDC